MGILNSRTFMFTCIILLHRISLSFSDVLPSIIWDPFNPLYNCTGGSNGHPIINVRPYDKLSLVCPHQALSSECQVSTKNNDDLYENAYLLQEEQREDFLSCNSKDGKLLLQCDQPKSLKYFTFVFKEHFGSPGHIIFKAGRDYFVAGTGNRRKDQVNNRVGGSCLPGNKDGGFPLKLQIHVCSWMEINVYKNCSICTTPSCYFKGCSVSEEWKMFGTFKRIPDPPALSDLVSPGETPKPKRQECLELLKRARYNRPLDVTYSETRFENIVCPLEELDCTDWIPVNNLISADGSGSCFSLYERRCSLPSKTASPIVQTKKTPVSCKFQLQGRGTNSTRLSSSSSSITVRALYFCVIPLTTFTLGVIIGYFISILLGRRQIIIARTKTVYRRARGKGKPSRGTEDRISSADTQSSSCSSGLLPSSEFEATKQDLCDINEEIYIHPLEDCEMSKST